MHCISLVVWFRRRCGLAAGTATTCGSVTASVRGSASGYVTARVSRLRLWLRSGVGTADAGGYITARVCRIGQRWARSI